MLFCSNLLIEMVRNDDEKTIETWNKTRRKCYTILKHLLMDSPNLRVNQTLMVLVPIGLLERGNLLTENAWTQSVHYEEVPLFV